MATKPAGNPDIWSQTTNYPAGADPWSGNVALVDADRIEAFQGEFGDAVTMMEQLGRNSFTHTKES